MNKSEVKGWQTHKQKHTCKHIFLKFTCTHEIGFQKVGIGFVIGIGADSALAAKPDK